MCKRTILFVVSLLPFAALMVAIPGCWWLAPNQPPTADAGADQTVVIGASVMLDGGGSGDPDGDPLAFKWNQTGGHAVTLTNAYSAAASFTAPGTSDELTFQLVVTDPRGAADSDTVRVTVETAAPSNRSPEAYAGDDQTVAPGAVVALDASGSSDPDQDALEFTWVQIAGTAVALNGADTATPSFTAPETTAELTFRLTVTDGRGGGDADTVSVTVALPPPNQPPEADAGDDQTVTAGASVTLDGSGSSDPDASSLTFSWTQLSGTPVSLAGADTASPTFMSPSLPTVLTFQLTVDDGDGGSDTDTVTVTIRHPGPPAGGRLFAANFGGNRITSYDQPGSLNGDVVPSACLAGPQTQLAAPIDVLVAPDGSLLVANTGTSAITVYNGALNATGDLAPERVVQGGATLLAGLHSLAMNPDEDLLFVSVLDNPPWDLDRIVVFDQVSTAAFNGSVAPAWTYNSTKLVDPWDTHWTTDDDLYATNGGREVITVFSDASTDPDPVDPAREVRCNDFGDTWGLFVDANDTLYVVDSADDQVLIFYNAAALDGTHDPDLTLTVEGAGDLMFIAVDSTGTGYITDRVRDAIYCYDNLAIRDGSLPPDRTIQGDQTRLDRPFGVFLLED